MGAVTAKLKEKGVIQPPPFLLDNIHYETMMGSHAYAVNNSDSDVDIYGFCIPPKEIIFPHLGGDIVGFGLQKKRFEQFQAHAAVDPDTGVDYDITIYSIVKYFHLCMLNNPNMIDSLFTSRRCVLHATKVANIVKENRKLFLHKGSWHRFKNYAYSQINQIRTKNPKGKRKQLVEQFGYDVKYAYHLVRLMCEVEQILLEHDIDLERNREQLKSIRRGEWTKEDVFDWFSKKEKILEEIYVKSDLREEAEEDAIKQLLMDCLEEHYGSLDGVIVTPSKSGKILDDLEGLLHKHRMYE